MPGEQALMMTAAATQSGELVEQHCAATKISVHILLKYVRTAAIGCRQQDLLVDDCRLGSSQRYFFTSSIVGQGVRDCFCLGVLQQHPPALSASHHAAQGKHSQRRIAEQGGGQQQLQTHRC